MCSILDNEVDNLFEQRSTWKEFCDHQALASAKEFAKDVSCFLLKNQTYRCGSIRDTGAQFATKFTELFLLHFGDQFSIALVMQELVRNRVQPGIVDESWPQTKIILWLVFSSTCRLFEHSVKFSCECLRLKQLVEIKCGYCGSYSEGWHIQVQYFNIFCLLGLDIQ